MGGILLLAATVSLVSAYRGMTTEFPEMLEKEMTKRIKEILAADKIKELIATSEMTQRIDEERMSKPVRSQLMLSLVNLAKRGISHLTTLAKNPSS